MRFVRIEHRPLDLFGLGKISGGSFSTFAGFSELLRILKNDGPPRSSNLSLYDSMSLGSSNLKPPNFDRHAESHRRRCTGCFCLNVYTSPPPGDQRLLQRCRRRWFGTAFDF